VAVTAYLGLGANLGDRLGNLQRAVDLLGQQPGVTVVRSSRVYETEPVGGPPQPPFLNAALEISTELSPHELLSACGGIENEMGRVRVVHWGPRPIDIDILTYDETTIDEVDLQVPHPRMHERGFVLAPLAELTEDPPLPGGRHLAEVRLEPRVVEGVRPFAPPLAVPS
jgi:2-amino-4-hydroxy-6-hydroxymethyldihydropteridine diphosphokinase